jgi:putative membrane protein
MSWTPRRTTTTLAVAALGAALTAGAAASPATADTAAAPAALSAQDTAYLQFAGQANLAEVALGKIAKTNANNMAVRMFGKDMVKDHSKQYAQLQTVAATVGYTLPTKPSKDQRKVAKLWSNVEGRAFTCAYVPFQWDDHMGVIAMTQKEIDQGSDPTVKAAAQASLPVLEEHLAMVTKILHRLKSC